MGFSSCNERGLLLQGTWNLPELAIEPVQNYVALRKAMITVQYQRIPLLLHEDEKLHLEALEQEAKEICQQLKESDTTE